MAAENMDDDVAFNADDLADLNIIPNLSGLLRLQTDPIQQYASGPPPEAEEDALTDLNIVPNLSGLSRLQTDPVQNAEHNDTISDLNTFDLPNLSGLSRLQTDPIQQQQQQNDNTENKSNETQSMMDNLELIPVFKFCKTTKIIQLLQNGLDSDFLGWNVLDIYDIAANYTLCICFNYLFDKLRVTQSLNLNKNKLLSFVCVMEKGYFDIPYHSSLHATDVMINAFHYLIKSELIIDDFDKIMLLITAICHDYKHPGFDAQFLINSKHEIALKYADKSILEQMYIAQTMKVLKNGKYNFLQGFDVNKVKYFKRCFNDMILGTDLANHSEHMKRLDDIADDNKDDYGDDGAFKYKLDVMIIGLHAADIGSVCKAWPLFEVWAKRIFEEGFIQGDKEKELGFELTQNMDREKDKNKINQRHCEFITVLMLPFYEKWSTVFKEKHEFSIWWKQLIDNNAKLKAQAIKL